MIRRLMIGLLAGASLAVPSSASPPALEGVVRQVGNDPHIELVITGSSASYGKGDYYVTGPLLERLRDRVGQRVRVDGTVHRRVLVLAGRSGRSRPRMEVDVSALRP